MPTAEKLTRGLREVLRPTPGSECRLDSSGNSLMERVSSVTGMMNSLFIIRRASFAHAGEELVVDGVEELRLVQVTAEGVGHAGVPQGTEGAVQLQGICTASISSGSRHWTTQPCLSLTRAVSTWRKVFGIRLHSTATMVCTSRRGGHCGTGFLCSLLNMADESGIASWEQINNTVFNSLMDRVLSSAPNHRAFVRIHLIRGGQLLAVGGEGDEASGQVDQAADLQVGVGAAGGRRADCVRSAHHVAVAPLDTEATADDEHEQPMDSNDYRTITNRSKRRAACLSWTRPLSSPSVTVTVRVLLRLKFLL
ncbi:hypothetical protein EYF80_029148 [Liparis tanakae]|uniref:Uncharacterized protein n=1 Tax=Liparis tanakae TaxID=230148 RepID=A0A4Z2H619_9TELE|nr:hypothetical protein EYF80_029148 [Liparis tanakae]